MILSILDIVGGITGIAGGLFIMYKMKNGYVAFGLSNIAFAITGFSQHNYGLVSVSLFNLGIDVIAYNRWAKEDNLKRIA